MILVLLNILWIIMVPFFLVYLELYFKKHIKAKLIRSFVIILIAIAFVIITILFTKHGVFNKKINNICFAIWFVFSGYIIYKAIKLRLDLSAVFYILFIFLPVILITFPPLIYSFSFNYWFWFFYLILFVFLWWVLEYSISKRIKIISNVLLFLGVLLFLLNNVEYWLISDGNLTYKLTISLLFQYFPMILFIWILFYQIKEGEKTDTMIKELGKKMKSNYFRNSRRYFFRNQCRYKRLRKIKYH